MMTPLPMRMGCLLDLRRIETGKLKDVEDMVVLMVVTVEDDVEVFAIEKLLKESVLGGCMSGEVALDVGVRSHVMVLVMEIRELLLTRLLCDETEEHVVEDEAIAAADKPAGEEENVAAEKENPEKEAEEVEPEEKQMTLEEYEKVLEEKRKALLALKGKERKVDLDKEFESNQLVSKKKNDDEVFIKLIEAAEKEQRAKKSVSINEFLKPAESDGHYRCGGRGRNRGGRGGYGGGYGMDYATAPSIEDPSQFPSLGAN
ncbi:RGG repeats nuclear RNA binding protein B [Bienertia sinuspersici]